MNDVRTIRSVIDGGLDRFTGVFFPGGHAPIVDVMQDPDAGEVLRYFHGANKPTAAICHGPISLLAALDKSARVPRALIDGNELKAHELGKGWQYAGYRMTVFSRSEEEYAEDNVFHKKLIFNMPDALEAAGAEVVNADELHLVRRCRPRADHRPEPDVGPRARREVHRGPREGGLTTASASSAAEQAGRNTMKQFDHSMAPALAAFAFTTAAQAQDSSSFPRLTAVRRSPIQPPTIPSATPARGA